MRPRNTESISRMPATEYRDAVEPGPNVGAALAGSEPGTIVTGFFEVALPDKYVRNGEVGTERTPSSSSSETARPRNSDIGTKRFDPVV